MYVDIVQVQDSYEGIAMLIFDLDSVLYELLHGGPTNRLSSER